MPLNYKNKEWDGPFGLKRNIFQIPKDKLYPIFGAGETLGVITAEASAQTGLVKGLKVIASGSDKACETLGVGCIDESTGSISLGSQATIETTSDRYYEVQRFIPPFPAVDPALFNPEINVYRGFWMISWFKNEFAQMEKTQADLEGITPEELLNRRLNEIPPGCSGLMLQPFWGNEITRPESRGSIIGFREDHTRLHIYRAIIEGIAFALYEGMTKIEKKSGVRMESLGISGGGAQSDVICQIFADIFNRKIYRVQTFETSGLGASIAAFRGLGAYPNYRDAVNGMVHKNSEFLPVPAVAEIYLELYEKVYSKIYGGLKSVYISMEKILERER
ncbi:MAG: hypothetical protein HGA49_07435 [Eubacteriaceae bacterium]|nr:hypothetical protein [Eubacteriaceae bacterium]